MKFEPGAIFFVCHLVDGRLMLDRFSFDRIADDMAKDGVAGESVVSYLDVMYGDSAAPTAVEAEAKFRDRMVRRIAKINAWLALPVEQRDR